MSNLERRPGNRPSRSQRERNAYRMVVASGTAASVFVVTAVLAVVGVIGWGLPLLALVVAVVCGVLFRRTVN